ncbi:hypothetical protein PLESTB_001154600 [Pleodorina starrii]|uniref:Uncharacterized protein n=1 Tax=Pleodorina starrii TaxID=330485 RepID=A0A9W6BRN7_9CHLO|nr:hypothetical protein PLESTM_001781300 [Pleodorina starrii]GLC56838.1 hypothetical protein PLESTB_001154600 [Pleodorina starrii]
MRTLMAGRGLPGVSRQPSWPNPGRCNRLTRRLPHRPCRPTPAGGLLTLASTVKEERKSTEGAKGEGGRTTSGRTTTGGSRTTSGRQDGSSSTRPSSPPPPQARQARPQAPPSQQQQQRRPSSAGSPPQRSDASRLDTYMRKHPIFSRFYDTTLILGDCVMILATEASSERIDWSSFPALVGVLLVCWVAAGAWNGDYSPSGSRAHEDVPWQLSMLGPTFGSVLGAALTWAFASTASVAAYAVLVARNALDAAPVVEGLNTDDLSPQLEVVVALLITMTCWRGIASKLRPTPGGSD